MIILQQFDKKFKDIFDIVYPHNKSYCEKYHIDYIISQQDEDEEKKIDINYKKYWNKIIATYEILNSQSTDWLFMLDADAILRHENNIKIFTQVMSTNKDIGICRVTDDLDQCMWNINIGAVFFRNTDFVKTILSDMIEYAQKNNYDIYEQGVLQHMLKYNYKNILYKTEVFSDIAFNNSGGPFVFHTCGEKDTTTINDFKIAITNKANLLKKEIEKYDQGIIHRTL